MCKPEGELGEAAKKDEPTHYNSVEALRAYCLGQGGQEPGDPRRGDIREQARNDASEILGKLGL